MVRVTRRKQRIALEAGVVAGKNSSAMWFYSREGAQVGPITDEELQSLSRCGQIPATTLIWQEGMAGWLPLAKARPELAGPPPIPSPSGQVKADQLERCSGCGGWREIDELVRISWAGFCAECKQGALQCLKEGVGLVQSGIGWRRTNEVVTMDGEELPCRCFKCNAPATSQAIRLKFSWHPNAYNWLMVLAFPIYLLLVYFISRRATVLIHLCDHHRLMRKLTIAGCWIAGVLGLAMFFGSVGLLYFYIVSSRVASSANSPVFLASIGIGFMAISAIVWHVFGTLNRPTRIEGKKVWFKGAGKPFLDSLPEQMN